MFKLISITQRTTLVGVAWLALSCHQSVALKAGDSIEHQTDASHRIMLTDQNTKSQIKGCIDPDLNRIPQSVRLTLCDGRTAQGKMLILSEEILEGVNLAGIRGTLKLPQSHDVKAGVKFGAGSDTRKGSLKARVHCRNGIGVTHVSSPQVWDDLTPSSDGSVDDFQAGSEAFLGEGSSNCRGEAFVNISGQGKGLFPDDQLGSNRGSGESWSDIFQDTHSGIYFTNVLANAKTTALSWNSALELCSGLSGLKSGENWRLPTQKELLQLYIDGISQFRSFGVSYQSFWSSTSDSTNTDHAITVNLANGRGSTESKGNALAVVCIRTGS